MPINLSPIQVVLVGDSTLAPNNGYGDALCARFVQAVKCINLAKNGRSSGSYRAEGSWQVVLDLLAQSQGAAKTYVLIEFGHNDQPGKPGRSTDLATEFPSNLRGYVNEVRAFGAVPVLATPLSRRNFKGEQLVHDLEPWADATRRVALDEKVPLLELLQSSSQAVQAMGHAQADALAVEPAPAAHWVEIHGDLKPKEPVDWNQQEPVSPRKSAFDHTHVGPRGAAFFASQVEGLMRQALPELVPYFQPQ
jgi:lysophospholipase L1-like esterase